MWTAERSSSHRATVAGRSPQCPVSAERRHLNQAALLRPLQDALRRLLQDRVPLRVGQDRRQPAISQAREDIGKLRWHAVVAEFDQQIVGFANGVGVRLFEHAFQILE